MRDWTVLDLAKDYRAKKLVSPAWFAGKDAAQAAGNIPVSDFSPRKHEASERGCLMGRYGAVPMLSALPETASVAAAPSATGAPYAPVTPDRPERLMGNGSRPHHRHAR